MVRGNASQGHFQGQARQLISQAIGRAILWAAKFVAFKFTQSKLRLRRAQACLRMVTMLDVVYVGLAIVFFAAFALYALGCKKL